MEAGREEEREEGREKKKYISEPCSLGHIDTSKNTIS
jgi:hypothetical protein